MILHIYEYGTYQFLCGTSKTYSGESWGINTVFHWLKFDDSRIDLTNFCKGCLDSPTFQMRLLAEQL